MFIINNILQRNFTTYFLKQCKLINKHYRLRIIDKLNYFLLNKLKLRKLILLENIIIPSSYFIKII